MFAIRPLSGGPGTVPRIQNRASAGGADTIIGGRESDQLWGGEGPDTFVFKSAPADEYIPRVV
jgi:hypothetical protein